ncbi:MAG: DUF2752 domain-containing protein [Lentisphaerae bacterium]|nr:DUF2752 domain-containing protein [Lentisphaerota bacterium]
MDNMNTPAEGLGSTNAYRDLNRAMLIVAVLVLAWIFALHVLSMALGYPLHACASRAYFGIPCPLCGLTRGLACLATGDLQRATAYNPLSVPVALVILAELCYRATATGRRGAHRLARFSRTDARLHQLALAAFIGYAIGFYLLQLAP